jgi:ketosteroid isomerase-like protein
MSLANPPSLTSPERAPTAVVDALNTGQLDLATACFARDACLVAPGETAIHGREEIRSLLAQLISSGARSEILLGTVLRAGDVAYARQRWTLSLAGPGGARHSQTLEPRFVLRLLEGEWKVAIAMPWR